MAQDFSKYVAEQLGWYVYALRDPRNRKIFYIGKGQGNRVFAHARDAKIFEGDESSEKISLIRDIQKGGKEVETFIVRHGISSEASAYAVEAALIDLLSLLDPTQENDLFQLTNVIKGHSHRELGCMSTQAAIQQYEAEKCPKILEPVILLRIPVRWYPTMSEEELFESTHGWWRAGERRNGAKYAMAVSAGVIRAIYTIDDWRVRQNGDRGYKPGEKLRFGFSGCKTTELDKYLNKSVKHLFKVGEQTPFKYLNC